MRIDNPYLEGKMFKDVGRDLVLSGRTCPANLDVRSCQNISIISVITPKYCLEDPGLASHPVLC